MGDRLPRKLAAILYADVAGYSRLTGEDEDSTHRRLSEYLDVISATVEAHRGRVMHYAGDAVLAMFEAVVDAVSSAVAIQDELNARNQDSPDARRVQFRIGLNLGDVIEDRGDIYGDGVNVAARLESLADAGGICISDAVRSAVGKKLHLDYEDMGEQEVKNIAEPVRVYKVLTKEKAELAVASPQMPSLELPEEPSIAVLPFANMSGEPEQEYFSDGIAEDIITALSRISGLLVIARNSTMVYKGKAVDVKQIGREQGVRYVLEGSVRKAGNRVRVTAQLIDATTGHHQWAERYDRKLEDIFSVQDDITHQIIVEMRVQISEGEKARMLAGRTRNLAAWECLLRADDLNNAGSREDNYEALRFAEEAVRLDPNYVSAWTELGWVHLGDLMYSWTQSPEQSETKAMQAAQKALELEESYSNAFSLLGWLALVRGEYDTAVELCERAVILSPSNAENAAEYAVVLLCAGKTEEATAAFERAIRLSPIHPAWYLERLGLCYYVKGEPDSAKNMLREAIARRPGAASARLWLISVLVDAGSMEEARQLVREVMTIEHNFSLSKKHGLEFKDEQFGKRLVDNWIKAGLPQ